MILNRELGARKAMEAIYHGMQFDVSYEEWPAVREAIDVQATVLESDGNVVLPRLIRAEIARHDVQGPRSRTGMIAAD